MSDRRRIVTNRKKSLARNRRSNTDKTMANTEFDMSLEEVSQAIFIEECEEAKRNGTEPPAKPLSNERVRQIQAKALAKIRQSLGLPISMKEASQR